MILMIFFTWWDLCVADIIIDEKPSYFTSLEQVVDPL